MSERDLDMETDSFMCLAVLGASHCCDHCRTGFTEDTFRDWLSELIRKEREEAWDECRSSLNYWRYYRHETCDPEPVNPYTSEVAGG